MKEKMKSSKQVVYKADLQRVGSLVDESLTSLSEYARIGSWKETEKLIRQRNLLSKRSSTTLQGILAAIRRRFLSNHEFLPNGYLLAKFVAKDIPKIAKIQALYPYICESDQLVKTLILNVVARKIKTFNSTLTKPDILSFIENEQKHHVELRKWSDYLKKRWIRGFLAFLRDFGIMEKAPSNKLIKPLLRVETFTFFILGLLQKNLTPHEALHNTIWRLYFMEDLDVEQLLINAQARGWFYYSKAGDIIEVKPRCKSLEGWLNECLG